MNDAEIIQLYWNRDEKAIPATAKKYGNYCAVIAGNILENKEDAEECVNDTYWKAWESMPPHKPKMLSAFLGKITRNLSLNRYRQNTAIKRGCGQTAAVLDEIAELVSGTDSVEQEMDRRELIRTIDDFLSGLPANKRMLFVRRYWYFDSISELVVRFKMTENHVSVMLSRLRLKLRSFLLERGFEL